MINDNLGKLLASMYSVYLGNGSDVILKDITGANITVKMAGIQGVANINVGFFANGWTTAYLQLGKGLTPVARSDFKTETPCTGGLAGLFPTVGAGYGSGEVTWNIVCGAATVVETVTEGTIYMRGPLQYNNPPNGTYYVFQRYNYTPLLVGIGDSVVGSFTVGI